MTKVKTSLEGRTVSNHKVPKKLSVGDNLHYQKINGINKFDPTAVDVYELDVSKWDKRGWRLNVK